MYPELTYKTTLARGVVTDGTALETLCPAPNVRPIFRLYTELAPRPSCVVPTLQTRPIHTLAVPCVS